MLSPVEVRDTPTGVSIDNIYDWPGWSVEVDIAFDVATHRPISTKVRDRGPEGTRRNARRPTDNDELVRRIRNAAEERHGILDLVSLALPSPHKKKRNSCFLRAETITVMYQAALNQGFSPRRVISSVYGLPVVDKPGERTLYDPRLHRWLRQARTTINPRTDRPFLEGDRYSDLPRRWPGSAGAHPLEPRRASPMVKGTEREGPYVGRTLTLRVAFSEPAVVPDSAEGRRIIGYDLSIEGCWDDGAVMPAMDPLQQVTSAQAPHSVSDLIKDLEGEYPGAKIVAKMRVPRGSDGGPPVA